MNGIRYVFLKKNVFFGMKYLKYISPYPIYFIPLWRIITISNIFYFKFFSCLVVEI